MSGRRAGVGAGAGIGARAGVGALAVLVTLIAAATLGGASAMAAGTVAIKTSFENSPISLNTSDAVGYALSNSSGAAQTISFTDTLPAGVTLDDPIGTTVTAGSSSACNLATPTANPGASSLTVTVTVPSATGTVCTVSFSILAGAPSSDSAIKDSFSGVSTASGAPVSTTSGALEVLSNPSLSFTAPRNNQSFYLGQTAAAGFSCSATDPLDAVDSFFGADDEGNQIGSGAPLDTVDPGAHTLEVNCYSAAGGGDVSQEIAYSVGSYELAAVKAAKQTDYVSFKTLVPAARLVAEVVYGKKVLGTTRLTVASRRTAVVTVKPTATGKRLLAGIRGKAAKVKLQVSLTPHPIGSGDEQITPAGAIVVTKGVKLPITHVDKG